MALRFGDREPCAIDNDAPEPLRVDREHPRALARELERIDEVEQNYTKYLDGGLSPALEQRVSAERARIEQQSGLPDAPSIDDVKKAWAEARITEPQPEDVKFTERIQADYALVKNVAWARALDAVRARVPSTPPPPAQTESSPTPANSSAPSLNRFPAPRALPQDEPPAAHTIKQANTMSLDELRHKAKVSPELQAHVNRRIELLKDHPDLQTNDGRQDALKSAQQDMLRAAALSDKNTERQLRIQVLALDDLCTNPRPRPLPKNESMPPPPPPAPPTPRPGKPLGPVIATEQMPAQHVAPRPPQPRPAEDALPTQARPLPVHSLELTDPQAPTLAEPARFVVRSAEAPKDPSLDDGPTAPDAFPHGFPEVEPIEPPHKPHVVPSRLGAQVIDNEDPMLRPDQDDEAPERPPIHKLSDLWPKQDLKSQSLGAPQRQETPDPSTAPGRKTARPRVTPVPATPPSPTPRAPETTREIDVADIVIDEPSRSYLHTQRAFDRYFDDIRKNRALTSAMRDDAQRLDRLVARADTDPAARALAEQVHLRAAAIRAEPTNNDLATIERQYFTLQQDEARPEVTGNLHEVDRIAFAVVRADIIRRERLLAEAITSDRMREVFSLPAAERQALAHDAVILMSTLDPNVEESPYSERLFVQRELREHNDDNDRYARVCALIAVSQTDPDNFLAFRAQVDPRLEALAIKRATSLLDAPAATTDAALRKELAEAKVALALARASDDPVAITKARDTAAVVAYVYDTLPHRRSYEVDTGKFIITPAH